MVGVEKSIADYLVSVVTLIASIWGLFKIYLGIEKKLTSLKDLKADLTQVHSIELAISGLKSVPDDLKALLIKVTRIETLTSIWQQHMLNVAADLVKQPTHFRKDELLDKLKDHPQSMSYEELCELKEILDQELVAVNKKKDGIALAYAVLLYTISTELNERDMTCLNF